MPRASSGQHQVENLSKADLNICPFGLVAIQDQSSRRNYRRNAVHENRRHLFTCKQFEQLSTFGQFSHYAVVWDLLKLRFLPSPPIKAKHLWISICGNPRQNVRYKVNSFANNNSVNISFPVKTKCPLLLEKPADILVSKMVTG